MEACKKDDGILIVDDDFAVRDFLERFLKEKGYQNIITADNGLVVSEILKKENIKLVLLDVKLPGEDGVSVLRKIKKLQKQVGVIMITGFPEEPLAKEAIKEGAYDYIIKPFNLDYLELSVLTKISLMG